MKIILFAFNHIRSFKKQIGLFYSLALISWVAGIVLPYISGKYIDILINIKDTREVFFYTKIILFVGVISCVVSYFKTITYESAAKQSINHLRLFLLEHIKRLPQGFFKNKSTVYMIDRISTDSDQIVTFSINEVVNLFINALTGIVVIIAMGMMNYKLTGILLGIIPVYFIVYKLFSKKLYSARKNLIENQNSFTASMNRQISNILHIKLSSLYEYMNRKIQGEFKGFFGSIMKFMKVASLYGNINGMIETIASVIIFLFGGIEVVRGNLTVGEFTIMNVYFNMLFSSVMYFGRFGSSYQRSLVCYNRVMELLHIEEERIGDKIICEAEYINIKNLSFAYENEDNILNDMSLEFQRGKIYCLKGENGSGKSTLMKVILGIEQDYEGSIFLGEDELRDVNMYRFRKDNIGIVEQEPVLMNDTIRNNILEDNHGNISEEEIRYFAEKMDLGSLIDKLPQGLDTMVDESNSNLSGGEKQKICIVRELLKKTGIMVFDEPSSALDINSILKLKEILLDIKEDKIIILISHNREIIDFSDEVIQLRKSCSQEVNN